MPAAAPIVSADRFEALEPVRQAVRQRFGAFAKDIAAGLELRHDHGSQYVSHHFQSEIRFLGEDRARLEAIVADRNRIQKHGKRCLQLTL